MQDSSFASQKRKVLYVFTRQEKFQGLALAVGMLFGAGLEVLSIGMVVPVVALMSDPDVTHGSDRARAGFWPAGARWHRCVPMTPIFRGAPRGPTRS